MYHPPCPSFLYRRVGNYFQRASNRKIALWNNLPNESAVLDFDQSNAMHIARVLKDDQLNVLVEGWPERNIMYVQMRGSLQYSSRESLVAPLNYVKNSGTWGVAGRLEGCNCQPQSVYGHVSYLIHQSKQKERVWRTNIHTLRYAALKAGPLVERWLQRHPAFKNCSSLEASIFPRTSTLRLKKVFFFCSPTMPARPRSLTNQRQLCRQNNSYTYKEH